MEAFDVNGAKPDKAPSVYSVGITGQITGSRATEIVADDIEVPKNSDTHTKREKLLELIKEFDAVVKAGGRVKYLGTPQTEQTIYSVLTSRGYVMRIWPARYPKDPKGKLSPIDYARRQYGLNLAPFIMERLEKDPTLASHSTDPKRFSDEDLSERELSYGRSGFALQFQLDTSLSDAEKYPLKLADLIVHPLDPYRAPINFVWGSSPELIVPGLTPVGLQGDRYHQPAWHSNDFAEFETSLMYIDPSGRGKDETAYAGLKLLHGRIFCVASGGYLGGYDDDTLKSLLGIAKKHGITRLIVEPNFGGGMFAKLLLSMAKSPDAAYQCGVEDGEWSSVSKEQRIIDTLEPVMNQHRLIIDPAVIEADYNSVLKRDGDSAPHYRLMYQLTRMVREKGALAFDDRLDALAAGVAVFTASLARDTQLAALEHKNSQLDKELEKFMKHALGNKGVPTRRMASQAGRGRK